MGSSAKKSTFRSIAWLMSLLIFAWGVFAQADMSKFCHVKQAKSIVQSEGHSSALRVQSSRHRCCVKRNAQLPLSEVAPINASEIRKIPDLLPKLVTFSPQIAWRDSSLRLNSVAVASVRGRVPLYQILGRLLI
jgi:hypothetical protein